MPLINVWNTKRKPKEDSFQKEDVQPQEAEPVEEQKNAREPRPQDDVPIEVIIHYIVKDYRRMWNTWHEYKKLDEATNQQIEARAKALSKRLVDSRPEEIAKLHAIIKVRNEQIERLKATQSSPSRRIYRECDELREKCAKLTAQVEELRSTRNAVIEAVTDDLQQKLDEANQRIKLLVKAVIDPEQADSALLQQCTVHAIETDDDRKWMAGATKQLEKAAMQLLSVADRLAKMEEALKGTNGIDIDKALKNHGKALSKLTAVISHIECFFDKVGDIQVIDDEAGN